MELRRIFDLVRTKETQFESEQATNKWQEIPFSETMFGAVHSLVAMETRWERERLVWISKQKIAELRQEPSDNNLHRTVLVKNTHSALKTWRGERGLTAVGTTSAFAICF